MMNLFSWHRLLLPLTIAAMLVVFTQKAANVALAASGTAQLQAPASAAKPATPEPSTGVAGPCGPVQGMPAAELALLADLRKRREALDARTAALDRKAELLSAAEVKLRSRLDELTTLQTRLEQLEAERRRRESANWGGLVKTYEDMKPRDAAAIFNVLDTDVLLEVLDRMDERKVAPILAGMLPERARQATQMLARKRLDDSAVESSPGQGSTASKNHS